MSTNGVARPIRWPESCVYSIKQAAREEADHGGILHRPPNEFQMRLAGAAR